MWPLTACEIKRCVFGWVALDVSIDGTAFIFMAQCVSFLSDFNHHEFSWHILVTTPKHKFQKNPSSRIKAFAYGERNRQTDMMKLTVDSGKFAVAPKKKNKSFIPSSCKPLNSCTATDTTYDYSLFFLSSMKISLIFWRWIFFSNFSTPCI